MVSATVSCRGGPRRVRALLAQTATCCPPSCPPAPAPQIFLTFFKTLEGKEVTVELKNDLALRGVLETVDQYLNFKLSNVSVVAQEKFPQLVSAAGGRAPWLDPPGRV